MKPFSLPIIGLALLAASCNGGAQPDGANANGPDTAIHPAETTLSTQEAQTGPSNFQNGIQLQESGLHATEAYLNNGNNQSVAAGNTIAANSKLSLHLYVEGWQPEEGGVLLGASTQIMGQSDTANAGQRSNDLFANTGRISADDAKKLTLNFGTADLKPGSYTANFRVWDKRNNASLSGNFQFTVQ